MAIDPGEKRVGVAISDESRTHARRLKVIEAGEDTFVKIAELYRSYHVQKMVVGRARTIEGELGHQAKKAEQLASDLKRLGLTVELEDETATTELAYERLKQEGVEGEAAKKLVDAVAAEIILEGYLSS